MTGDPHRSQGKAQPANDSPTPLSSSSGQKRTRSQSSESVGDRNTGPETAETTSSVWKGWAELENDPVIFTSILRDHGIQDITSQEVIPLESIFDQPPGSVIGLIFLSRWMPPGDEDTSVQCPPDLWFANQISTFSCATVALMNIVMNRSDLTLGPELTTFKQQTTGLTPKDRGLALDDFQFAKDIHNSFASELDRLIVDLRLKEDHLAASRRSKKPGKGKKGKKGKKRRKVVVEDEEDENGFHFIAYVPGIGHVWKLDGLQPLPRRIGSVSPNDNWLTTSIADVQAYMEASESVGTEFSLLSLVRDTNAQTSSADAGKAQRMKEDWAPFITHMIRLHAEKGSIGNLLLD